MALKGKISHIEIYVSNLERSQEFWGWVLDYLGYDLYQRWDEGVSWIKDGSYIVLVQTEERFLEGGYHRCRTGLNHIAFYCDTAAEVDELTEALKRKGAVILYPERHPHAGGEDSYSLFFEDPDRIKVEVTVAVTTEL